MSEEIKNEDILPASLEPGEPVITQEQAEKFQPVIDAILAEKNNEVAEEAEVKVEEEPEVKAEPENVITNTRQNAGSGDNTVAGITAVENGVIGTGKVERKPKASAKSEKPKVEKVAVHSTKNVTWNGVGKVYRGYNLVTPEQAEKWLTRSHIRTATPEEVAREFGK